MFPRCRTNAAASLLGFASVLAVVCALPEFQSYDGSGNNLASPLRGAGGSMIPRLVAATTFADANLSMAVGLPGERRVSVELFEQLSNSENAQGVSTITGAWGQFVIHDMMQTSTSGDAVEILPAPVDPKLSSPFYLRRATRGNGGLGTPINFVSSYLDGSAVYGNSTARVGITQHTGGLMLARADTGLPAGTADVMEAVRPTSWLALAGDRRANNNPGLFSIQGLMVLEHNYWAAAYEVRKSELGLHSAQEVFDMARRRVIAEIQVGLVATRVLARARRRLMRCALLAGHHLPGVHSCHTGGTVAKVHGLQAFCGPFRVCYSRVCGGTVRGSCCCSSWTPLLRSARPVGLTATSSRDGAIRYGHSGIRSVYPRRDPEGSPHINGPVLLRDAFFDPGEYVPRARRCWCVPGPAGAHVEAQVGSGWGYRAYPDGYGHVERNGASSRARALGVASPAALTGWCCGLARRWTWPMSTTCATSLGWATCRTCRPLTCSVAVIAVWHRTQMRGSTTGCDGPLS